MYAEIVWLFCLQCKFKGIHLYYHTKTSTKSKQYVEHKSLNSQCLNIFFIVESFFYVLNLPRVVTTKVKDIFTHAAFQSCMHPFKTLGRCHIEWTLSFFCNLTFSFVSTDHAIYSWYEICTSLRTSFHRRLCFA